MSRRCAVWGVGSREAHVQELSGMYSTAVAAPYLQEISIHSGIYESTEVQISVMPARHPEEKYRSI